MTQLAAPLRAAMAGEKRRVESRCRQLLKGRGIPRRLRAAMAHSLFSGGKRLRPILLLWTCEALATRKRRARQAAALDVACALEMIHTYSLIHDDLPAMDDDVLRRGRPTCHIAFDEATAILAGDALLTIAFEIIAETGPEALPALRIIAAAAGPGGMVGGQQEDLDAEGKGVSAARVRRIHLRKTARLIAAALSAGAALAGARDAIVEEVEAAGIDLGLAFQGADDILDVTAESGQLGKSAGKDEAAGKATLVSSRGLAAATAYTKRTGGRGLEALRLALPDAPATRRLLELCSVLWNRSS